MGSNKQSFNVEEENAMIMKLLQEWKGFRKIPVKEVLKRVDYRISIEKLFKPDEYAKLCKLEKKRIKNIGNNLTVMMYIGIPLPSENGIRAKVGLPPRRGFIVDTPLDSDNNGSDEEWTPNSSGRKKNTDITPLGPAEIQKREAWFQKNCMVKTEAKDTKPASKAFESIQKGLMPFPVSGKASCPTDSPKEKQGSRSSRTDVEKKCYPKRSSSCKVYEVPDVPNEDDFLFCDDCEKLYLGECSTHGPYTVVQDTPVKLGLFNRARRTSPPGISIKNSGIKSGGMGAWCDISLSKNTVFGPYEGAVVNKDNLSKLSQLFHGGYAWEIYKKSKLSHYIDGTDVKQSNWMRYINCARNEEEQNLVAYQYKGKIYYRTYKDVREGSELLVWYGDQYAEHLGIPTEYQEKKVEHLVKTESKISLESFFPCTKCDRLFADEATLSTHVRRKHPDRSVQKKHRCLLCPYSTDHHSSLRQHERTHTNEQPFECDVCGKKFSRRASLGRHKLIHSKVKLHKCDQCDKSFSRRSVLGKHARTVHDKIKSHVCRICGKAFGELAHLTRHIRRHTGEKPYKCKDCPAAFSSSSELRRHVICRHTKQYPHKCKECGKGFLYPSQLKAHMANHHSSIAN